MNLGRFDGSCYYLLDEFGVLRGVAMVEVTQFGRSIGLFRRRFVPEGDAIELSWVTFSGTEASPSRNVPDPSSWVAMRRNEMDELIGHLEGDSPRRYDGRACWARRLDAAAGARVRADYFWERRSK